MLALDMGMGKTLCVVAAHALEQHTLPEQPTMHTAHSKAALGKVAKVVYVGRRYPDEPDRENLKETDMFTGFMQADDRNRTIVPDGSVRAHLLCLPGAGILRAHVTRCAARGGAGERAHVLTQMWYLIVRLSAQVTFEGRGNLVVAPNHLATQWEREIKAMCVKQQRVIIVYDKQSRDLYLSSVEGMRMCALVATPSCTATYSEPVLALRSTSCVLCSLCEQAWFDWPRLQDRGGGLGDHDARRLRHLPAARQRDHVAPRHRRRGAHAQLRGAGVQGPQLAAARHRRHDGARHGAGGRGGGGASAARRSRTSGSRRAWTACSSL